MPWQVGVPVLFPEFSGGLSNPFFRGLSSFSHCWWAFYCILLLGTVSRTVWKSLAAITQSCPARMLRPFNLSWTRTSLVFQGFGKGGYIVHLSFILARQPLESFLPLYNSFWNGGALHMQLFTFIKLASIPPYMRLQASTMHSVNDLRF